MGLICTAGREPKDFGKPVTWEQLHPAGHDPKARLKIQDEESIVAEVLYPSLGMVLCNHPDWDYKAACWRRTTAGWLSFAPPTRSGWSACR